MAAAPVERVPYDEFSMFRENADEFGIPWDGPPAVRREAVEVEPGRRLSALVWGDAEPELVLLHGGAQNAHTWDTVALALDRPLVAIDLPAHGHSDGPRGGFADPTGNAEDVAAAMRVLAPAARGVVGMSLGGLTALALSAGRARAGALAGAGRHHPRCRRGEGDGDHGVRQRAPKASPASTRSWPARSSSTRRARSRRCAGGSSTTPSNARTGAGSGATPGTARRRPRPTPGPGSVDFSDLWRRGGSS